MHFSIEDAAANCEDITNDFYRMVERFASSDNSIIALSDIGYGLCAPKAA